MKYDEFMEALNKIKEGYKENHRMLFKALHDTEIDKENLLVYPVDFFDKNFGKSREVYLFEKDSVTLATFDKKRVKLQNYSYGLIKFPELKISDGNYEPYKLTFQIGQEEITFNTIKDFNEAWNEKAYSYLLDIYKRII